MNSRDPVEQGNRARRGVQARSKTGYVRLDSKECKACWKCVEACPENVIGRINIFFHKHVKIVNQARCTGCRKCVKACDYGAISPVAGERNRERQVESGPKP